MSEPEFDHDDPDAESMFDFLAEEGAEKHRRQKRVAEASERSLPIIRKPVPVSESGPLLPPKPGAPVEPPPALTGGSSIVEDDLDFLNDMSDTSSDGQPWRSGAGKSDSDADSNITRLDPRSRRIRDVRNRVAGPESRSGSKPPSRREEFDDLDLDLDLDNAPEFNRGRKDVRVAAEDGFYDDAATPRRGRWLLLALILIATGVGSFLYANPDDWRVLVLKFRTYVATYTAAEDSPVFGPDGVSLSVGGEAVLTDSPLRQRFRKQLLLVEGLVIDGALDDAEKALTSMDRTVYGYGAAEFGDLERRIEQLRSSGGAVDPAVEQAAQAESERLAVAERAAREAEARAAAEQAQDEEQARLAAQATRKEEAEIAAAAEQAAQEDSARRAATEQSAREEQARVAAQQAAQEEQARAAAAKQAAQEEQARVAAENARQQAARLEQERQEEQARLSAQAARTSDWSSVDADRRATDRRIAAERAAVQRQQAREQRLIEAREREVALAAQAASQTPGNQSNVVQNSVDNDVTVASGPRPIGDDELQTVYRRFIDLQQAVSSRDINAVVGLTQRSGIRVQQLMQIFENSTQIDARIRNVSTSNATGQIKGTLQINRVKRADGTFVEPPAALSSIPLSSEREGNGWSAISW